MKRLFEEIRNWAGGVNTSAPADALGDTVSPLGRNSALTQISPMPPQANVSPRQGGSPALTSPLTSEPAVIGQYHFRKSDGNTYHILVCGDGSLRKRNDDSTSTVISASPFTAGDELLPGFAVANDLLFICNGTEAKKFDGTTLSAFGLAKPSAPTAVAAGSGGIMPAGTYDVLTTQYNSATGHESQISDSVEVTIAAGEKIQVDWTDAVDAQVTHTRVYARQRARGANYYRVIAGATPAADATHGGYTSATNQTILDITETQWENFVTRPPVENENYPPPTGAKSPTWHRSRMFVHDGSTVYWSKIELPEAFDYENASEPVNPDDGEEIIGMISADDVLLILKDKSTWAVVGDDPSSWTLENISREIGGVNQQSMATLNNLTFWWDAAKGPIARAVGGQPEAIGVPLIGPTVDPTLLNPDKLHLIVIGVDNHPARQRVIYAVPEVNQTRNTLLLPFNTTLRVWESSGWNPFDVASMATVEDSSSIGMYMGGYSGRLFHWWNAFNDGVAIGTTNSGTVTSSTATTLTCVNDAGASPGWTVNALKELYAYAISADGEIQRRRIVSNTANVLTVLSDWTANPNDTYTWVVGGIDFQFDTPWIHGGAPFRKKRYEFLFLELSAASAGMEVDVDVFLDLDINTVRRTLSIALSSPALYDTAIYDTDRYASAGFSNTFHRMSRTGRAWRARVRSLLPETDYSLLKIAMQSILLSHKN
jgi:hypothetical protein